MYKGYAKVSLNTIYMVTVPLFSPIHVSLIMHLQCITIQDLHINCYQFIFTVSL